MSIASFVTHAASRLGLLRSSLSFPQSLFVRRLLQAVEAALRGRGLASANLALQPRVELAPLLQQPPAAIHLKRHVLGVILHKVSPPGVTGVPFPLLLLLSLLLRQVWVLFGNPQIVFKIRLFLRRAFPGRLYGFLFLLSLPIFLVLRVVYEVSIAIGLLVFVLFLLRVRKDQVGKFYF